MLRAILVCFMLLGILYVALRSDYTSMTSLQNNQQVKQTYTVVETYTVYSMHWESLIILQKTAYVTATLSGWSVPEGAQIISSELRVYPAADPEWRGWFTYEGQQETTVERVVFASGIGHDPEPYYKEYTLAHGEYVYAFYIRGIIHLQDKYGSILPVPVVVPSTVWGEYTDYHVGDVVEYVRNPIYIPTPFIQTAMAK